MCTPYVQIPPISCPTATQPGVDIAQGPGNPSIPTGSTGVRPMRARCLLPALLGSVLTACASAPPPEPAPEADAAPFIKLANRRMAVALRFAPNVAPPGYQQAFGRAFARRLESTYRTRVTLRPIPPTASAAAMTTGVSDALVLWAVQQKVDDVVVVRVTEAPRGGLVPTAEITSVGDLRVRHRIRLGPTRAKTPAADRPAADRVADLLSLQVSRTWTDPGAAPRVRPIGVANRLAQTGRCRPAVAIYDRVMPKLGAGNSADIRAFAQAQRLHDDCKAKVKVTDMMRADKGAAFRIVLELDRLVPEARDAFRGAARRVPLDRTLGRFTDKPVRVTAHRDGLVLRMRYHPERLRPKLEMDGPDLDLSALVPAMQALVDLRNEAAERMTLRRPVEEMKTTLRLERMPYDYVEIDFAELDGRILLTDTLRVKVGQRPAAEVVAQSPRARGEHRFALGRWESRSGAPTPAALLARFLEL